MLRYLPLAALLAGAPALAQVSVQGRVVDARTLEPLAFVHVVPEGRREGATSGIDGRFAVAVDALPARLRFSYVGYAPRSVEAASADLGAVRLDRIAIALPEAEVLPGE
ncbi:MAG: carboxypeptidase-like regulatory domain-containing protein, partial [Flavobacteriales bacterium]